MVLPCPKKGCSCTGGGGGGGGGGGSGKRNALEKGRCSSKQELEGVIFQSKESNPKPLHTPIRKRK